MRPLLWILVGATFLLLATPETTLSAVQHAYLTWSHADTSRTMTVNVQSDDTLRKGEVYYDTASKTKLSEYRWKRPLKSRKTPFKKRHVYAATLDHLKPNTTYYFAVGDGNRSLIVQRKFRTLPLEGEIRFAAGGDMGAKKEVCLDMLKQAARFDPMFLMIGGDIAYGNGRPRSWKRWDRWLDAWEQVMITSDGHRVPMILAIGNHEVRGGYRQPASHAPFYFGYFHQDSAQLSYFIRYLGNDGVLFVLDSSHIAPHGPAQARWLKEKLRAEQHRPYKFALYHVPLYPSHRPYDYPESVRGRQHWLPVFDKFQLTAAFENHDHTLKRTKPLRKNKVATLETGTLYIGDGAMGRGTRRPDPKRWFIEKAGQKDHIWIVESSKTKIRYRAFGRKGELLDEVTQPLPKN